MKKYEKMSREELMEELIKRDNAGIASCERPAEADESGQMPGGATTDRDNILCRRTEKPGHVEQLFRTIREAEEALRRSEEPFRSMFDNSMDAIFLTSPDGRIHSANPAACSMYGMTEEEIRVVGRDGLIVRDKFLADALQVRGKTGEFRGELNCIRKDGTVFPVETTSSVFRDGDGSEKTMIIQRDITCHKEMENTLLESEKRYRSLFGNMQEGFAYCRMLFDADCVPVDFIYLEINGGFEKLTGLTNVIGKRVSEVIPGIGERHPELFEIYGRVALTGQPEKFEMELEPLGAWLSVSAYSTEKEYFVAVFDNITERRQAEESLRESEERWQLAIEGSNSGVWDWNIESGETFYSDSLREMSNCGGHGRGNRLEEWMDRTHPEDRERVMSEVGKHLDGGSRLLSTEHRFRCADGSYRWIMERGKVTSRTPAGKPLRMVGIVTDITERKQLEEQLYHAQKMESVGQLAGGVAHEFNNILTAMTGFAQLLEIKIPAKDPMQRYVSQIQGCVERAAKLTQGLLSFSRTKKLSPRVVDLNEVMKGQQMMLRALVRGPMELRLDLAREKLPVHIDCIKIEQVIMNLVSNAKDALPDTGVIIVGTSLETMDSAFLHAHGFGEPGAYACIFVSDTGCGMDVETSGKIFEPFFTTKEVGKGTGLGLSVAYGIIKQHKGCIEVWSEPGKGTTFRIYLPLVDEKKLLPGSECEIVSAVDWKQTRQQAAG